MSALNFIQVALSLESDLFRQVFGATLQYDILPQSFSGLLRLSFTLYHLLFCLCYRSILPWSSTEDTLSSCTRAVAECQHYGTVGLSSAQYDPTSIPAELSGQLRLFEPSIQSYSDQAPNRKPPSPNADIMEDIDIIAQRRVDNIINGPTGASNISAWMSTLGSDGKWPASEIDYTTGCNARRASWPAQVHWLRIVTMSAAWHGGLPGADHHANSTTLRTAISSAMGYWFTNDITNIACLDQGGLTACPCGTPGFWNTNWFSNIIGIPEVVGEACLLLNGTLLTTEIAACSHITLRAFDFFDTNIHNVGALTGANALDVAKIGLDQGLRSGNGSLVTDAFTRVHNEVVIQQVATSDGIRPDGSFGQHDGVLYNGNYGKVYANDDLDIEIEARGTRFEAGAASKAAFVTLLDGDTWMLYRNVLTSALHWDFSVLGRFISFPVIDAQATGAVKFNVTEIRQLGTAWESDALKNVADTLQENTTDANAGSLMGNRMFYDNDYMVQRGSGYVTTVKMYSTRTTNSECINSQNPLGFHLSDGTVYTYLRGDEYEDIAAAWDWHLIPGITTDYAATPLNCRRTGWKGIEQFVGGVSDTKIGVAAMRYSNPFTHTLSWQKAWFFLKNDVQFVMVNNLSSNSLTPLYSVLDQRRHTGDIFVNGTPVEKSANFTNAKSLWHGGVGYTFDKSPGVSGLSVKVGKKTGDWSLIGISTRPPKTVDLFAAYLTHSALRKPISYAIFPGTETLDAFDQKRNETKLRTVRNDVHISALFDDAHQIAMVVFWDSRGGSVVIPGSSVSNANLTMSSNGNSAVIYQLNTGKVTVSDPSQTWAKLDVKLKVGSSGNKPPHWGKVSSHNLSFHLPISGSAGSSVSQNISKIKVPSLITV